MIEKTLKTLQGKLQVRIPTRLDEVTLGQMMDLQAAPTLSDMDAISILSGVPLDDLQQVNDAGQFTAFAEPILSLSHEIKYLYNSDSIPKTITVQTEKGPVTVNVTRNLAVEPAGAFMAARDVITDEITEHIKKHGEENWQETFNPSLLACVKVLAYYLYCRVTGKKFDEYAVTEFIDVIKKLMVTEALPIAKHFFMSYPNLLKTRTGFWQRLLQLLKNVLVSTLSKSSGTSTP